MALHSLINHCQSENTGNIEASEEIAVSDKTEIVMTYCPHLPPDDWSGRSRDWSCRATCGGGGGQG